MARTFADDLATDAELVFLCDFAETIVHYALGTGAGVERQALVTLTGQGIRDERLMRQGFVRLPTSVAVTAHELHRARDTFSIGGNLWGAMRIESTDAGIQTIAIERYEPVGTPPA